MLYTDIGVRKAHPDLEVLEPDQLVEVVTDSTAIYDYVHRQGGGADETAIRKWGEGKEIGPDRVNRALSLLRGRGQLLELRDPAPIVRVEPPEDSAAPKPKRRRRAAASKGGKK